MAKIRAYKLAEELGIEKSDFVEKAAAFGVVLKSAMATVSEEEAVLLRKKLGSSKRKKLVTESRSRPKAARSSGAESAWIPSRNLRRSP